MKIAGYDIDKAAKYLHYINSLSIGGKNRLAESVKMGYSKISFEK